MNVIIDSHAQREEKRGKRKGNQRETTRRVTLFLCSTAATAHRTVRRSAPTQRE